MEEEKALVPMAANSRVSPSFYPQSSPPPPPALPLTSKERPPAIVAPPEASTGRQMFTVELKPGETTIVSWKKLFKEAGRASKNPPSYPAPPVSKDVPAVADSVGPQIRLSGLRVLQDRKVEHAGDRAAALLVSVLDFSCCLVGL